MGAGHDKVRESYNFLVGQLEENPQEAHKISGNHSDLTVLIRLRRHLCFIRHLQRPLCLLVPYAHEQIQAVRRGRALSNFRNAPKQSDRIT